MGLQTRLRLPQAIHVYSSRTFTPTVYVLVRTRQAAHTNALERFLEVLPDGVAQIPLLLRLASGAAAVLPAKDHAIGYLLLFFGHVTKQNDQVAEGAWTRGKDTHVVGITA